VTWDDFVGQEDRIGLLKEMKKKGVLGHVLIHGGPGLGKSTLAKIVADDKLFMIIGATLSRPERVSVILETAVELGYRWIFIDEVHAAKVGALEVFYPVMEEGNLYTLSGEAKPVNLKIIAATTEGGSLPKPFVDRFDIDVRLRRYTDDEMKKVVKKIAANYGLSLSDEHLADIARRSLGTPRTARRLISILSSFSKSYDDPLMYQKIINATGIESDGLGEAEKTVLQVLWGSFLGQPVGLTTLSMACSIDQATLTRYVEPVLVRLGYLKIDKQGRRLTRSGQKRAVQLDAKK
jgi:Holliday junction DNA helicase RuvB